MRYRIFDPQTATDSELSLWRELESRDPGTPLVVDQFTPFSMLVARGFRNLSYKATLNEQKEYFWIDREHASQIGRALCRPLDSFALELTMVEPGGYQVMADALGPEAHVGDLTICHVSADEETVQEAPGLAALVTKLKTHSLHLWAAEFEPGALDAFTRALAKLGNRTLRQVDVCEPSKRPPDDQVHHEELAEYVARNAAVPAPPPAPSQDLVMGTDSEVDPRLIDLFNRAAAAGRAGSHETALALYLQILEPDSRPFPGPAKVSPRFFANAAIQAGFALMDLERYPDASRIIERANPHLHDLTTRELYEYLFAYGNANGRLVGRLHVCQDSLSRALTLVVQRGDMERAETCWLKLLEWPLRARDWPRFDHNLDDCLEFAREHGLESLVEKAEALAKVARRWRG